MKTPDSPCSLLSAAVLLGTAWTAHAAFTAVDNFNSRTLGDINTQGGWVATNATTAQVIVDPGSPINKILHHTGTGDAGILLPATIANSSTGTYFFRVKRVSDTSDDSFGLAQAAPTTTTVADFNNFRVHPYILNAALRGRDVASSQNVVPAMSTTAWYKVWLVVNNVAGSGTSGATGDHYKMFVQSDDDLTYSTQTEFVPTGDTVWNFRVGTLAALVTAQFTSNIASTSVYYDDLYIDNAGQNLSDPSAPVDSDGDFLNDDWEIFYFNAINTQNGSDGATNGDNDGLTNEREETLHTNPNDSDSDDDTLSDGNEADGISNAYASGTPTNPADADSDDDGLSDFQENGSLNGAFGNQPTNPNSADTDSDGYSDHFEVVRSGTNPNSSASAPLAVTLITPTLRNGGFDLLGPPPGAPNLAKATHWDSDPDGDVTYWTVWAGESTTEGNSGTEGNPKHAFLENGSAAYNITDHFVHQGDVVFFNFDNVAGAVPIRGGLVYNSGTDQAPVINRFPVAQQPATEIEAATTGTNRQLYYTIPAGSPAIGKKIGVGFKSSASWSQADNVTLTVAAADGDHDALPDGWEVVFFGNTAQPATGDFENDGTDNLTEFRLGLDPKNGAAGFKVTAVQKSPTSYSLTWPSQTGVSFTIERSIALAGGSWTILNASYAGAAGATTYVDNSLPAGTKAFYKVTLNP